MKQLLVATDLSARSDRALHRGAWLAERYRADLQVLHVVDGDRPESIVARDIAQAEELLAGKTAGRDGFHRCSAEIATGDPFEEIVKAAEARQAELIIMGPHRKRTLPDLFVGTTVERVMRTGHHPVLMATTDGDRPYRTVMAAVDLSDASAHALREASRLGILDGASLTVLHVFDPMAQGMTIYAGVGQAKVDQHVATETATARQALHDFVERLDLGGLRYDIAVEQGDPLYAIAEQVEAKKPDLLLVGTRGGSAMKRFLLGSVAGALLRNSPCDVLAVPPRPAGERGG